MTSFYDCDFDRAELALDAAWERRQRNHRLSCQCGDDLPGTCPGPANCPNCDDEPAEVEHD